MSKGFFKLLSFRKKKNNNNNKIRPLAKKCLGNHKNR